MKWTQVWRDGWVDGWMEGWVEVGDYRARDLFSHDLVLTRPVFFPHSPSFFPRRVVSVSEPAVLASLGHYGIPPCHAPSIPLPPAVSCPLSDSIFTDTFSHFNSIFACLQTSGCIVATPRLTASLGLFKFFFPLFVFSALSLIAEM